MPVLLSVSLIAMATVVLKLYHFHRCRLRSLGFVESTLEHIRGGDTQEALSILAAARNPVARALEAGVTELVSATDPGQEDADREMVRVGMLELHHLETGLRVLSSVPQLSPLLGLLGTVWGMVSAFAELEKSGSLANPSLLSGGISAALLTTAFGLIIAIPSTAALNYFEGRVDGVLAAMKDSQVRILSAFRVRAGRSRAVDGLELKVISHGA